MQVSLTLVSLTITPIYPELGRQLSTKDINQMIVRVRPYFNDGKLSFEYIPERIEKAKAAAFQLIDLDYSGITVLKEGIKKRISKAEASASLYLTVAEFEARAVNALVVKFDHSERLCHDEIRLIERPVWPKIGRALTPSDIGKKMLRTYPYLYKERYEYSIIPCSVEAERDFGQSETLINLDNPRATFMMRFFPYTLHPVDKDSNYLSSEEFLLKAAFARKEVHVLAAGQLIEIRK